MSYKKSVVRGIVRGIISREYCPRIMSKGEFVLPSSSRYRWFYSICVTNNVIFHLTLHSEYQLGKCDYDSNITNVNEFDKI